MIEPPHNLRRGQAGPLAAFVGVAVGLLAAIPASSQTQQIDNQSGYSVDLSTPFRSQPVTADTDTTGITDNIAKSSVGTVGKRQEARSLTNIKPTARLDTRIANRVQSRIRNRIDRFYDPQANATSPFKVAADQASAGPSQSLRR